MKDEPSENKCKDCARRRKDGWMYCDNCMNKLWETSAPSTSNGDYGMMS